MRTCLLAVAAVAVASANFCGVIKPDLPTMCTCTNATDGFTLACTTPTIGVTGVADATVDATYDFKPCASPATTGYSATASIKKIAEEKKTYTLAKQSLTAGETKNVAIPDASISTLGGLYMATTVKGNIAAFEIDLGVTACAGTGAEQKCGAAMPDGAGKIASDAGLPIQVLKKTFDFSSACSPASVLSPSGLSMIASAIFALMHIWH